MSHFRHVESASLEKLARALQLRPANIGPQALPRLLAKSRAQARPAREQLARQLVERKRPVQMQGDEALLQHIQELAMPEDYVNAMSEQFERAYGAPTPGRDVLLITGVGKAYPFVRAHDILENAQPVLSQIPVALFYPGIYDGQSLRLFGSIQDGNYYRAFSLL